MKESIKKEVTKKNKKTFRNQILLQKSNQRNKYLGWLRCKILYRYEPKNKEIDDKAQGVTTEK